MFVPEIHYICVLGNIQQQMNTEINRLKVVLVEQKKTGRWLAEQLGKDPATISKWCNNKTQPSLEVLRQIASLLNVDVKDLLLSSK